MEIERIDHLVLTVANLDATLDFYVRVLGMEVVRFGRARVALGFGRQKINLHESGWEISPHAAVPQPGSADLCLIMRAPLQEVLARLEALGVEIELGPVERDGATGSLRSIYCATPTGTSSSSRTRVRASWPDRFRSRVVGVGTIAPAFRWDRIGTTAAEGSGPPREPRMGCRRPAAPLERRPTLRDRVPGRREAGDRAVTTPSCSTASNSRRSRRSLDSVSVPCNSPLPSGESSVKVARSHGSFEGREAT